MRLILLGKPPIVINHPKADEIKKRYIDKEEKLGKIEDDMGLNISIEDKGIYITE